MREIQEKYLQACLHLPADITAAEAEGRREVILSLTVSGGELTASQSCDVTTISVRAGGDKIGYAFSQNLEEEPEAVIRRAAAAGELAAPGIQQYQKPTEETEEKDIAGESREWQAYETPSLLSVAEGIQIGKQAEEWAKEAAPDIIEEVSVTVGSYGTDTWTVNHLGWNRAAGNTWLDVTVEVVLKKEDRRYNVSWCTSVSDEEKLLDQKEDLQRSIRRNAMAKAKPIHLESGTYRVLLSRESLCQMLVNSWIPFSGCRQKAGTSFLSGKLGERIGSDKLNIVDAPCLPQCGYARTLDCEGVEGKETWLVTKGILTGRLNNLDSAAYFGEEPGGNAGRSEGFFSGLPTGVVAIPNVTYIVPGDMTEEDMLDRLGDGVWITETYDPFHSINIGSGDFSIPCNGVLVRDGKPVGALNSLTINGNLRDLFSQVEAVGDRNQFWRFYTGLYYLGGADVLVGKLQVNG
jgi:PmbA protein